MKKLKIIIPLMVMALSIHAQTISRKVVSSAGGTLNNGNNQITYTIGETLIPSLSGGSSAISQGFQQPGERITTSALASSICAGSNISVPFTSMDMGGGNVYTAQLSNASGSFASPTSIGTLTSYATSGSISCTIPSGATTSSAYKIRVVGSFPAVVGSERTITINALPSVTASNVSGCSGSSIALSGSPAGGTFSIANPYSGASTTYTYTYIDVNGCTATSSSATVTSTTLTVPVISSVTVSSLVATVSWGAVTAASSYDVQYKTVAAGTWTSAGTVNGTSTTITLGTACTQYLVRVRANCSGGSNSAFSSGTQFSGQTTPVQTAMTNAANNSLKLNWGQISSANKYVQRIRKVGTTTWTFAVVTPGTTVTKVMTGLTAGTTYEAQIQAVCSNADSSAWSNVVTGTTTGVAPAMPTKIEEAFATNVSLYPNPTSDVLNIDLTCTASNMTTIKVLDLSGRLVKQVQVNSIKGDNSFVISFREYTTGIYLLEIYEDMKLTHVTKIEKK
jgi:hypothetical protein